MALKRRYRKVPPVVVLMLQSALMAAYQGPAQAQTAAVGDRYSGEIYTPPVYQRAAAASGPILSWPGKTAAAAPSSAWAQQGYGGQAPAYASAAQTYRPAADPSGSASALNAPAAGYRAPAYPAQASQGTATQARLYGPPPVKPWYQRYGAADVQAAPSPVPAPAGPQARAPQSICAPPATPPPASSPPAAPPPRPAPVSGAANDGETARFYSLHRQYGLTPDPDPIPPQFFTRTADLTDPAGPNPSGPSAVYKAGASSSGATNAVRAIQPDDPTSTLGQP